jgi:hypothetical protein
MSVLTQPSRAAKRKRVRELGSAENMQLLRESFDATQDCWTNPDVFGPMLGITDARLHALTQTHGPFVLATALALGAMYTVGTFHLQFLRIMGRIPGHDGGRIGDPTWDAVDSGVEFLRGFLPRNMDPRDPHGPGEGAPEARMSAAVACREALIIFQTATAKRFV